MGFVAESVRVLPMSRISAWPRIRGSRKRGLARANDRLQQTMDFDQLAILSSAVFS
jgi:hypothetical protein